LPVEPERHPGGNAVNHVTERPLKIVFCITLVAAFVLTFSARTLAQTSSSPTSANSSRRSIGKHDLGLAKSYHEDWTAISLAENTLIPGKPVLGAVDDAPGGSLFVRDRFQMQWRPNDPLDLFVVRPKGVAKPPVIIYLYSFPQDTDRFKDNVWCTTVTSGGFAAVGFVSALTGHRMEHRAVKDWFVSELQESLGASAHDVQMILNYLETRGDLDMEHVGMFGQGSGGAIAILASAADSRIKVLDLLTPWGDWPDWLAKTNIVPEDERAKYLTPDFLVRAEVLDPIQWLPKIKAQSLRIQNVRQEPQMPDDSEEKIEAAAPEMAEINKFGDSAALFPRVTGGRLLDWMKGHLAPDSAKQTAPAKSERVHNYPAKAKSGLPIPFPSTSESTVRQSTQP
jgi:hypothetical protein